MHLPCYGDAKNVLRASYSRLGEQVMGRDGVTTFGADDSVSFRREYDNNLDGVFETVQVVPASSATLAGQQIAKDLHQPYLDEFIVGFRQAVRLADWSRCRLHQSRLQGRLGTRRHQRQVSQPRRVSRFWVSAWSIRTRASSTSRSTTPGASSSTRRSKSTMTKNMNHGFQLIAGVNRQWHKMDGTWNPSDPAAYVQPGHFANNANLYMPRGNNDENSLPDTGNALSYGPTWMKYRGNFGGVWQAPWGVNVAGNLTVQAGPWSGSPLYQLSATDPDVSRTVPPPSCSPNGSDGSESPSDSKSVRLQQPRRGPGSSACHRDGRPEGRKGHQVPALSARGGGQHLQSVQRGRLHAATTTTARTRAGARTSC